MSADLPSHLAETRRRAEAGARLVLRGIVLNAGLALAKFAGGVGGHTDVRIADGTESLLDVFSALLVWMGFRVAAQPPDADHPYGHGKAEPLAALAVAVTVFSAAAWIGIHSVHEIVTPHQGPQWQTLPLLVAVVGIKLWFSRRLRRAAGAAGSTALNIEAWHHYSDALTSGAAFAGISIAVIGGRGWETADDWAALVACAVIAFNGVNMCRVALGDIMDTAAPAVFDREVRAIAGTIPGVLALDKCRVRKSGLSHLVDIQVRVDGGLTVREGHDIAHAVKDALLASPHAISDVTVHVEPMK